MTSSKTFSRTILVLMLVFVFLFVGAPSAKAFDFGDFIDIAKHSLLGPAAPFSLALDKVFGIDIFSPITGVVTGIAGSVVKLVVGLINSLIFFTTIALFEIGGGLIATALDFNSKIGTIAMAGYNVTLGLANMGFIVALVVIAFATMFRQEGFGYKKALPRVIIAALLINFGFFIVTKWLIAPVDQVTFAISNAAHFDPGALGDLFSVNNLFGQFASFKEITDVGGNVADIVASIMSIFLAAAFSFIGIISIFAMAIMFFIRGIALSILLILLPIAWVMWIFPNLKLPGGVSPWQEWWQNFTRWLLFGPFALFFLWLAISLANTGELFPDANSNLYSAMGQMIVTAGLILGGLLISNKMGITGASVALGAVAAGKVWAQSKAKRYGVQAGRGTIRKALPRERLQKLESLGTGRRFFGKLAAPARAVGRRAVRADAAITKAREAEFLKKIENLAPFQISDMYAGLSEENRAYALRHMIDKGYDWELVPEARKDIVKWNKENKFNDNVWGLKKAELDLVDAGISPDALAKMDEYRPALEQAVQSRNEARAAGDKTKEATHEKEIERIKYILEIEVEEILRKDMNVITASGMGKLQRRTFSSNPEKLDEHGNGTGKFKVGYAMFGDDEVGATMATSYGSAEMRYIHFDRADAERRLKASTRGDGATNLSRSGVATLDTVKEWFIEPLLTASGTAEDAFRKMDAPAQIALLQQHWPAVKVEAEVAVRRMVDKKRIDLSLDPEEYTKVLNLELAKIERAVPERLIGNLRELVNSSRGSSTAVITS